MGAGTDLRLRAAYAEAAGVYRVMPEAVARPRDTGELLAILAGAHAAGMAVIARGAGTGMAGGNVGTGLILDLTALDEGMVQVDGPARLAVTSAGAPCAALVRAAALHGLRMPAVPSSWRWATLGGMVATNAAGTRSYRHGSVRRWVDGLTLVTADGHRTLLARGRAPDVEVPAVRRFLTEAAPRILAEAERIRATWPATRKNSCGYALDAWLASGDLLDLVIGAEGTLGVITSVRWRLAPVPQARAGLRLVLGDDEALRRALAVLEDSGASAVELLDRTFLAFVRDALPPGERHLARGAAMLLVEYEGTADEVREALAEWGSRLAPIALDLRAASDPHELDLLWEIRHAASPILARLSDNTRSLQIVEDGCVPPARLVEYLAALRGIAARHGVQVVLFGHAGDANIHANLLVDVTRADWEGRVRAVFDEVSCAQVALGGTPAGEHGAGRLRAALLPQVYGREVAALFGEVKRAFDPEGLLNPGVIVPGPGPLPGYKMGPAAAPLPAGMASALRDLERAGAWDRDRVVMASLEGSGG